MTSMPIRATLAPTALAGQTNGAVDPTLLGRVDRDGYIWQLAELPARGMRALHAAILTDLGVTLTSTGRGRSFKTQYDTFLQRYNPVSQNVFAGLPTAKRKLWPDAVVKYKLSSIYWALKPNNAMAAVPGTSPHGMWCADDLALPDDDDADTSPEGVTAQVVEWLYTHELAFGFAHSHISEQWHIQWFMGDQVPDAVRAYELSLQPRPPTEPTPTPTPPPIEPMEDDMTVITNSEQFFAAKPGEVKWLLREDGKLRQLDPLEWEARGSLPGTGWSNKVLGERIA